MRVLAICDDFIVRDVVEPSLESLAGDLSIPLETHFAFSDWPTQPFQFNDEIQEFVGRPEEIAALVASVDPHVLIVHMAPVSEAVIARAKSLRAIAVTRGGPVNVNVRSATRRGIPVFSTPGRNAETVAEFTVGLIVAHLKHIAAAHADLSRGNWRTDLYHYTGAATELGGKTLGIVGFGAIGRRVLKLFSGFDLRFLVSDPHVRDKDAFGDAVRFVSFEELLEESDIVSLHARVTPQTTGLIDAEALRKMKPTAHLINTARGPLVDYEALYTALVEQTIAGAALDTFSIEPPSATDPLLGLPNVTVTPHIAGSSKETVHRALTQTIAELAQYLKTGDASTAMNFMDLAPPKNA